MQTDAATGKELCFHFHDAGAFAGESQRWVMCSFFTLRNGVHHVGQSQTVKVEEWPAYRSRIESNGWINKKPIYGRAASTNKEVA